ncbi:MAG: DUF1800 family protein [Patescibacteria group bacterium]|nr:DUF1800 family protein [Patescibacteria group bacterium]
MIQSIDGNNGLADNTIDYIFSKREYEIALFLADKFFRFYIHDHPSQEDMETLTDIFVANDFDIFLSTKEILSSDLMYSDLSMNSILFKSPLDLVIGTFQLVNTGSAIDISTGSTARLLDTRFLRDLGWKPYNPESIFGRDGWDDNSAFYNGYTHNKWITDLSLIIMNNESFDLNTIIDSSSGTTIDDLFTNIEQKLYLGRQLSLEVETELTQFLTSGSTIEFAADDENYRNDGVMVRFLWLISNKKTENKFQSSLYF